MGVMAPYDLWFVSSGNEEMMPPFQATFIKVVLSFTVSAVL